MADDEAALRPFLAEVERRATALSEAAAVARGKRDALAERVAVLDELAHGARVGADFGAAAVADGEAAVLRPDLERAEGALAALEAACLAVGAERAEAEHRVRLAEAEAAVEDARVYVAEKLATIPPLLAALRSAVVSAERGEQAGRQAASEAHQLRIALGMVAGGMPNLPDWATAQLQYSALLRAVKLHNEQEPWR